MKKGHGLIFLAIIVASIILHLFNLSQPNKPVFDEVYFATFAANYAKNEPHFDVHPPLGKIIYSFPLFFQKEKLTDAVFIAKELVDKKFIIKYTADSFKNFPYLDLRLISAAFGILLTVAVYLFIKNFTQNRTAALLGMFFVAFENAMLLETRLILLNGMYLVFGFLALAVFFSKRPKPFFAGLLWGLSLSVKLIGIVFLAPIIFSFLFSNSEERRNRIKYFFIFLVPGLVMFLIVTIFINSLLVPATERLAFYHSFIEGVPLEDSGSYLSYLKAFFIEIGTSIAGYTKDIGQHTAQSKWFEWLFMSKPMVYSQFNGKSLALVGNPVVWLLGLLAVIYAILKRKNLVLLGSYIFALIPFILVQRVTFLYHYFPALIFAISLAALLISEKLNSKWLIVIGGAVILFFVIVSPFTFGF